MKFKVDDLINPRKFQDPLEVIEYSSNFLFNLLERMLLIRLSEEKLAKEREAGVIKGPVHLSAGQEAIAVGIANNLSRKDRVFGAHRSHSHILSLNPSPHKLFAEVLGRETGFSKGMGGSMHLIDMESGFYGSVPIVSGTVALAVGAAFEASRTNRKHIGVAFIGDGAMEEGVVHESLNLSKVLPAPTLFVVENNLYASHMHMTLRQPDISTIRFAEANSIANDIVDGNNVLEVYESSKKLIAKSRTSSQPSFIEAFTYRHYGHVDWRKDVDVGVERSQLNINEWLKRDPIKRLYYGMKEGGLISSKDFSDLESEIQNTVNLAWATALNDPYPSTQELLTRVYSHED